MSILMAAALPLWSHQFRSAREEEAIFRGLQYAEAIRVFQKRFGRYPVRLEELLEVRPRSIRRLWTDPLSDHGYFGLIVQAPQNAAGQEQRGRGGLSRSQRGGVGGGLRSERSANPLARREGAGTEIEGRAGQAEGAQGAAARRSDGLALMPRADAEGEPIEVAGLPIHGVYIDHEGAATRLFLGESEYAGWAFTADLIPIPLVTGDRPPPSVRSDWIGKPFPESLSAAGGSGPDGKRGSRPQELGGGSGRATGRPAVGDRRRGGGRRPGLGRTQRE